MLNHHCTGTQALKTQTLSLQFLATKTAKKLDALMKFANKSAE